MKATGTKQRHLGIEGGGTRTTWAVLDAAGRVRCQGAAGPGNTLLLSDAALRRLFREIRQGVGREVTTIGGAFAGCGAPAERRRVSRTLRTVWPAARRVVLVTDIESGLTRIHGSADGLCVTAGTGSNVAGRRRGRLYRAGGYGHLISDQGSAYDIARRGLAAAFDHRDRTGRAGALAGRFLRATGQRSFEELVVWVYRQADKTDLAALAPCVLAAAAVGDRDARQVVRAAAADLAGRVAMLARRLGWRRPAIGLVGGLFENVPAYVRVFRRAVRQACPGARVVRRRWPGAVAAAHLALGD
ncbi:hypothetical protein HQ590_01700 [bacterium]|nr:hypothetical protein [bacterium]